MRHFRHHIGDYAAATAHLSMLEDAAYHRLLRHYYQHEKALPKDVKQIFRITRASQRWEKNAVETVLNEFFTLEQDGWHQRRADEEINIYKALANRARTNGAKHVGTDKEPSNTPESVDQPITNNQEPITTSEDKSSAPDLMSLIFSKGIQYLSGATGRSDGACRSIVGKWRKSTSDEVLIKLLGDAQRQGIVDPCAWIEGAIKQTQKAVAKPPLQL